VHEASIAYNIIQIAIKVATENKAKKINRITIVVGELNFLDLEALKFAFEVLVENTMAEKAELGIKLVPAKFKCLKCGEEWEFSSSKIMNNAVNKIHFTPELIVDYLKCPRCNSNEFEIINGKELYVENIEVTI